MRRVSLALAVLLVLGTVAEAAPWDAEPTSPAAVSFLARGRALYKIQHWDEAIAAFEAGALEEPSLPIWEWNLGQAHRQAGHYERAKWYYQRFVADTQTDPTAAEAVAHARQFIVDMEAAERREPRDLAPAEPGPRPPMATPAAAAAPTSDRPQPWYADGLGWTLAGVGAISVGVGSGLLLHASSLDAQADDQTNFNERSALRDRASSQRTTGAVLTAVGGGVVVAAIIKLASTSHRAPPVTLATGPGDRGVSVSWTW